MSNLVWSAERKRFYKRAEPEARFWPKVDRRGPDECWPWLGAKLPRDGRGRFYLGGKWITAPRASWIIHNGPLADGMLACHTCDNPRCVNPAHLYAGTYSDNLVDAYIRGQNPRDSHALHGSRHPMAKTNEAIVLEVRRIYAEGGKTLAQIGAPFGLRVMNVFEIIHRITWKHI
jgi:hypothetical protein